MLSVLLLLEAWERQWVWGNIKNHILGINEFSQKPTQYYSYLKCSTVNISVLSHHWQQTLPRTACCNLNTNIKVWQYCASGINAEMSHFNKSLPLQSAMYGNRQDDAFTDSPSDWGEKSIVILAQRGENPTAGMNMCLFSTTASKQEKMAGILPWSRSFYSWISPNKLNG